jgi:hypothetical protein
MSGLRCEQVRDRLPESMDGRLDAGEAALMRAHLADCAECRAESELIALLRTPVTVPAELEARVVAAVRAHAPIRRPVRHYAMAATFVLAIISGALFSLRNAGTTDPGDIVLAPPEEGELLLRGPGLTSLSEAELEALLKEIES